MNCTTQRTGSGSPVAFPPERTGTGPLRSRNPNARRSSWGADWGGGGGTGGTRGHGVIHQRAEDGVGRGADRGQRAPIHTNPRDSHCPATSCTTLWGRGHPRAPRGVRGCPPVWPWWASADGWTSSTPWGGVPVGTPDSTALGLQSSQAWEAYRSLKHAQPDVRVPRRTDGPQQGLGTRYPPSTTPGCSSLYTAQQVLYELKPEVKTQNSNPGLFRVKPF